MFDENAVFLEVSVSQNLGHRIWDPFPLPTPTVRRPLPLYAGGAGVSGGGVRRVRRPSLLDRVVHAARAAAAGRCACYAGGSGGRVVRASRPAGRIGGWVGKGGGRASRGLPAHAVIQRRAGRAEICRTYSVIIGSRVPNHLLPGPKTLIAWTAASAFLRTSHCIPSPHPMSYWTPITPVLFPKH